MVLYLHVELVEAVGGREDEPVADEASRAQPLDAVAVAVAEGGLQPRTRFLSRTPE